MTSDYDRIMRRAPPASCFSSAAHAAIDVPSSPSFRPSVSSSAPYSAFSPASSGTSPRVPPSGGDGGAALPSSRYYRSVDEPWTAMGGCEDYDRYDSLHHPPCERTRESYYYGAGGGYDSNNGDNGGGGDDGEMGSLV